MTTFSGTSAAGALTGMDGWRSPGGTPAAYIAAIHVRADDAEGAAWLTRCYRLTARIERVTATRALLDLGRCAPAEARCAIQSLLAPLDAWAASVRVGLAPSCSLAQLALCQTGQTQPFRMVMPAEVPAFLRPLPVAALAELRPRGIITAEVLRQLRQYGLSTLGHLARLGPPALQRQFGMEVGGYLAAVAAGQDPRPLCPTPPPATLTLRLRLPDGTLRPAELPAVLPLLAARAITLLRQAGLRAQHLCLTVRWDDGTIQESPTTLAHPTHDLTFLTRALRPLLQRLLEGQPDSARDASARDASAPALRAIPTSQAIAGLRLTLGKLRPVAPIQGTFWQERSQRLAMVAAASETLTVRYGRALVLRPRLAAAAAIFPEERYSLLAADVVAADVVAADVVAADVVAADVVAADVVAADRSAAPLTLRTSPAEDPWQRQPQRLHWW